MFCYIRLFNNVDVLCHSTDFIYRIMGIQEPKELEIIS